MTALAGWDEQTFARVAAHDAAELAGNAAVLASRSDPRFREGESEGGGGANGRGGDPGLELVQDTRLNPWIASLERHDWRVEPFRVMSTHALRRHIEQHGGRALSSAGKFKPGPGHHPYESTLAWAKEAGGLGNWSDWRMEWAAKTAIHARMAREQGDRQKAQAEADAQASAAEADAAAQAAAQAEALQAMRAEQEGNPTWSEQAEREGAAALLAAHQPDEGGGGGGGTARAGGGGKELPLPPPRGGEGGGEKMNRPPARTGI